MGIPQFSSSFFIDKTKQEKQNKLARAKVSTRDTFHFRNKPTNNCPTIYLHRYLYMFVYMYNIFIA